MDDNKLFILHYINMQEELNLDDKERMWSFLKEATDDQITYYVDNGSCVNEMKAIDYVIENEDLLSEIPVPAQALASQAPAITPSAGQIDMVQKAQQKLKSIFGTMKGVFNEPKVAAVWQKVLAHKKEGAIVGATVLAAVIAAAAYKAYKHYYGKYAAQCKGKKGPEKRMCIVKAKIEAKKQQFAKLQKASGACDQTKDPKKCKLKLKNQMDKIKTEINKIKSKDK